MWNINASRPTLTRSDLREAGPVGEVSGFPGAHPDAIVKRQALDRIMIGFNGVNVRKPPTVVKTRYCRM